MHTHNSRSLSPSDEGDMATMVLHSTNPSIQNSAGVNKRYRPVPAKTFQCRGYGECRMVFSRSEHLARHIRKHTGERPFTCHCGKQFSRLDNLRQHAQTVHADKQEQNERMMRDLTSLHATMAAASKSGQPRGKRSQNTINSTGSGPASGSGSPGGAGPAPPTLVKQEDDPQSVLPTHQRPGTSTGYEGTDHHPGILYQAPAWHVQTSSDLDRPTSRHANSSNHSFRDHHHPGQSFLAPLTSSTSTNTSSAQSQSFLPFASTYSIGLSDHQRDGRPGSSSSRPPTSGGLESHPRSLPPLSSVVPASIPLPSSQHSQHAPFASTQHVFPFPSFRGPSTAPRPGTAPATYFGGPGMVHRPELSFLTYGRDMAAPFTAHHPGSYDSDGPHSPNAGPSYDSPFSFHPPALSDALPTSIGGAAAFSTHPPGSSSHNPRKRPFTGVDGPESGNADAYDYGSESRPQSRRLTVMELCNDTPSTVLLPGPGGSASRPGTSSGLITSASALALVDKSPTLAYSSGPSVLTRAGPPADASATTGRGGEAQFSGGGISTSFRRGVPTATVSTSPTSSVLSPIRGSPALSDASGGYSQRASPLGTRSPALPHTSAHATTASHVSAARGLQSQSKPSSPSAVDAISRRGNESEHDQVRIAVSATHSPTPVGMRV